MLELEENKFSASYKKPKSCSSSKLSCFLILIVEEQKH